MHSCSLDKNSDKNVQFDFWPSLLTECKGQTVDDECNEWCMEREQVDGEASDCSNPSKRAERQTVSQPSELTLQDIDHWPRQGHQIHGTVIDL